jgi:putative sigma-54 modulation protein
MLQKFEIKSVHTEVDDNLQKYVTKKIGRLDKYLPRHYRESAHAVVELKEAKAKDQNKYTCKVTLHLPHGDLNVSESTMNMFAAVDIVETKLKLQIKKYKDTHASGRLSRHMTARFRRKTVSAVPDIQTELE